MMQGSRQQVGFTGQAREMVNGWPATVKWLMTRSTKPKR